MTTESPKPDTPADDAPANPASVPAPVTLEQFNALASKIEALAGAVDKLATRPAVPETDTGKPTVTPKATDPFSLPPVARMAAGYTRK